MRITRGQFLRFAVVVLGTGGTAFVACDAGTAATPGGDDAGGPLSGGDAGEGGHSGPQKPDGSREEDAGLDATTTDADAGPDANDGGEDGGVDAGEDAPVVTPACEQNGATGNIATNHGHDLVISAAAFANVGGQQTFQLALAHGGVFHTITLTDVEMNQLVAGQTVVATSTGAGVGNHTHTVTITCA